MFSIFVFYLSPSYFVPFLFDRGLLFFYLYFMLCVLVCLQ